MVLHLSYFVLMTFLTIFNIIFSAGYTALYVKRNKASDLW